MNRYHLPAVGLIVALAGCAASPEAVKNKAYDAYWQCTTSAVQPYLNDRRLPADQAARRALAHCDGSWQQFRRAQVAAVRDRVDDDNAALANQLGARQAMVWRQRVTRALTDYVRQARGV